MSFCITVIALYTISMRNKIANFLDFNRILFDNSYSSKSYVNYNDLFVSLEKDLVNQPENYNDIDSEEIEDNQHHHDAAEQPLSENYFALEEENSLTTTDNVKEHHADAHKETNISSLEKIIPKDISEIKRENNKNIPYYSNERFLVAGESQYVLPIADALERNAEAIAEGRNRLKKDIAYLYEKRKKMTLLVRKLTHQTEADILQLKKLLSVLNVKVPEKLNQLNLASFGHKITAELGISITDISWRYPELKNNLDTINRLQAFVSFLPMHDPIYNARKSSLFGYRSDPFTKRRKMHSGLDYAARSGTPIIAPAAGIVQFSGYKGGYGQAVDVYHGNGIYTRYAHMSRIHLRKGQRVNKGQLVGAVGSTGRSTGAHLHYEIRINGRAIDPLRFLSKKNSMYSIFNKYK